MEFVFLTSGSLPSLEFLVFFSVYIFLSHSELIQWALWYLAPQIHWFQIPPLPCFPLPLWSITTFTQGSLTRKVETIQSEIEVRKWNHPEVPPALSPEFSVGYFKGSTNSANAGYVCISGYFILANFITALMSSMLKSSFPSKPFIFVVFVNN